METNPADQQAFEKLIASEAECRSFLATIRWPDGFHCPACGSAKAWRIVTGRWECGDCGRQTSVTAGTLFQDTRYPLHVWFQAIWYVAGQKYGASALGLQRLLGLGSYQTAWSWLHRLRRAMVCPRRDQLSGTVQIDETFWGSEHTGKRGRGAGGKTLILVGIERKGNKLGRVRLVQIPNASGEILIPEIVAMVAQGSAIESDGWSGYRGLAAKGYDHKVLHDEATADLLPQVHLIVSLLKRWLMGIHQGGIQASHLDYYLDEFTFRFNRRTSRSRGLLFRRILENAVQLTPIRGADLRA